MAQDFNDFKEGLSAFNDYAEKRATRMLRRYSMKALQMIVEGTPVLTGCCRANWIVSVGGMVKSYDDKKADKSGGETVKAGLARLESVKLGTDVFISNSTPYVFRLENGWSRQKPPGSMIRQPLAKLRSAIEKGAK